MLLTLAASTVLSIVPSLDSTVPPGSDTIVDVAKNAGSFETLLVAVDTAGLTDTLMGPGPFTVFAPNDAAFAKLGHTVNDLLKPENRGLLTDILTFHVVPGEFQAARVLSKNQLDTVNGQRLALGLIEADLYVESAKVIATDVDASNGVVHVIDTVLTPQSNNIVELAAQAGQFELLLTAATKAGLAESLIGEGPYTVLAPTDDAFNALGHQLEDLLLPENRDTLRRILSYHVIPGRVYADQALSANQAQTLAGPRVSFRFDTGRLKVNNARIISTDLEASNGVVHVITQVLLPPAPEPVNGRLLIGYMDELPSQVIAAQFGLDRQNSRVITSITQGSNAERDGLRKFDILVTANGMAATNDNVEIAKKQVGFGGYVEFDLIRDGKRQSLLVQVGVDTH